MLTLNRGALIDRPILGIRLKQVRPPANPPSAIVGDDLVLTVEQRFEVEILLDYYRSSAQNLQATVRPQYRALMDSVRTKIEAVLSDEQVEQYRSLLQQVREDRDRQNVSNDDQN